MRQVWIAVIFITIKFVLWSLNLTCSDVIPNFMLNVTDS